MGVNKKFRLLGFDTVSRKASVMVLDTGRHMKMGLTDLTNSEVMDDFNTGEIKAIYRKLYSSENNPITQYDFQDRFESQWVVYALFCICVSVCYVFSNISATKPVYIEYIGVIITPGTFIYPFSFLIIDLLNEFYGFKLAKKAIYMSVLANALIFLCYIYQYIYLLYQIGGLMSPTTH